MNSITQTARNKLSARLPLVALAVVLQSGCSLFGVRSTEEAAYSVLQKQENYEIRQYEALVVASTLVESDFDEASGQAFRRLFNYISGDNKAGREIAMTAPVIASENMQASGEEISMTAPVTGEKLDQGWRFSFVLPASYTLSNAPLPIDERVELAQIPARKVASLRYTGSWKQATFDANATLLLQWVEAQQLQPDSLPRVAGYDPPWTLPFLRRNEVLIDIKP
jgi:hypothetical protein